MYVAKWKSNYYSKHPLSSIMQKNARCVMFAVINDKKAKLQSFPSYKVV